MGRYKRVELDRWLPTELSPALANSWLTIFMINFAFIVISAAVIFASILIILPSYQDETPNPTGCTKLGLQGPESNLDDEQDEKYAPSRKDIDRTEGAVSTSCTVKSLWIFPIKSCAGVELATSTVLAAGLAHDRQFCFAQLKDVPTLPGKTSKPKQQWENMSQKQFPLLSQIRTEVYLPDPERPAYKPNLPYVESAGALIVSYPHTSPGLTGLLERLAARIYSTRPTPEKSFVVPLVPTPAQIARDYPAEPVAVLSDTPIALNMGLHVPAALRHYLGCENPMTLMRVHAPRSVYRAAPGKAALGYQPVTAFADVYPLHVLGVESVRDVSALQPAGSAPLSVGRFRANIVVSGAAAYAEDEWARVRIGEGEYHVCSRCVRCKLPNVDQKTGRAHQTEPERTIRKEREVDSGAKNKGCLGMNMVPAKENGMVKVGMRVEVLETGEHVYV